MKKLLVILIGSFFILFNFPVLLNAAAISVNVPSDPGVNYALW